MPKLTPILATLWLLLQVTLAVPTYTQLERVPRHLWDTEWVKRTDDTSLIGLQDHENFTWASTDTPHSKAVVVSMVAFSRENERILDMEKFSFALASASCTADDFSVKFVSPLIYAAAKIAWNWVNFNDLRTFVIVPDWTGCGADRTHDPWVVSKVTFNDTTKKVVLDATLSDWTKVMNSFVLDFGEVTLGDSGKKKRDLIPDLNEKFTLDLTATLPETLFEWDIDTGVLNGSLVANCDNCGTSGALIFSGHVEVSFGIFSGISVDKFELSVQPRGIQAHLGLSLEFEGELDYREFTPAEEEITLFSIPVEGWSIPHIFEFGPSIDLNVGYEIDYIGGSASIATGVTASISDDAIAKIDLLSKDTVQISGWAPTIETEPLEIKAMIDAQARLYTEIALSVSISVLDTGFGVDIGLKVPELVVTTSAGVDSNGFCEVGGDAFGVKIDTSIGADLVLQAWDEVGGDKNILYELSLYDVEDIFTFPELCLAFGEISDNYCMALEELDNMTDAELAAWELDDAGTDDPNAKRDITQDLAVRRREVKKKVERHNNRLAERQAEDKSRRPYTLNCDSSYSYRVLSYPGPTAIKNNTNVPVIEPNVGCAPSLKDCPPDTTNTVIDASTPNAAAQRAIVFGTANTGPRRWTTEHIYEGNWINNYLNYLQTQFGGSTCSSYVTQFYDSSITPAAGVPKPTQAADPTTYIQSLLQNLGTIYTVEERMVLLPMIQNNHKFNMFAGNELVGYFTKKYSGRGAKKIANDHGRRSCDLARIVTACRYYDEVDVQLGLQKTIVALEGVLAVMDTDPNVSKPDGFSFVDAHQKWYNQTYYAGITHVRDSLQKYAAWMLTDATDMATLSSTVQSQIDELANQPGRLPYYCPDTPRVGW